MKTSKITRTFVFVLGAVAAAGSAEGMDSSPMPQVDPAPAAFPIAQITYSQLTDVWGGTAAYVPNGAEAGKIVLENIVTLRGGEEGSGWISVSGVNADGFTLTFPDDPWIADENTGAISFGEGYIDARGGFTNKNGSHFFKPYVPGIRTGVELDGVTLPTEWLVRGPNCGSGDKVIWNFDGNDGSASTSTIIEGQNTIIMELKEKAHHKETNQLYQAPELRLNGSDYVRADFKCRKDESKEWTTSTPREEVRMAYLLGTKKVLPSSGGNLTQGEIDAYKAALAFEPIRVRAVFGESSEGAKYITLVGSWQAFRGSHFVVGGKTTEGSTEPVGTISFKGEDSLPQSDITVLGGSSVTFHPSVEYSTGDGTVVDLRGCASISGGQKLTLGKGSKLVF